jgi:hypothetical protein
VRIRLKSEPTKECALPPCLSRDVYGRKCGNGSSSIGDDAGRWSATVVYIGRRGGVRAASNEPHSKSMQDKTDASQQGDDAGCSCLVTPCVSHTVTQQANRTARAPQYPYASGGYVCRASGQCSNCAARRIQYEALDLRYHSPSLLVPTHLLTSLPCLGLPSFSYDTPLLKLATP